MKTVIYEKTAMLTNTRSEVAVEAEIDNIRAAWQWAIELAKVTDIQKADETLDMFFQFQGRYLEGVTAFERAPAPRVETGKRTNVVPNHGLRQERGDRPLQLR